MDYYMTIRESLVYIENHLEESLTLDSIAKVFNISKYYFNRLFSSMMGISLKQYILSRKLNYALELIQEGEKTLTDISYKLNFANQASFTRSFKKHFGVVPSRVKSNNENLGLTPVPTVIDREVKNFNGDIVADFTLTLFEPIVLSGVVFEIDIAKENFKNVIHSYALAVHNAAKSENTPSYMIYSNCQPGSSKFKAMYGLPIAFETDMDNVFTVSVPELFCSRFRYYGDLLNISDTFKSDFGKFLKLTQRQTQEHDIELIQVFHPNEPFMESYDVFVPIEKTVDELEEL